MKSATISAALSVAFLSYGASAALTVKLSKTNRATTLSKRHILPRQTIFLELLNNITGGSYAAQVTVGSPPQEQNVIMDTGSSDLWFLDSDAALCNSRSLIARYGGCSSTFDSGRSSSLEMVQEGGFNISYIDGSGSSGDYVTDNIGLGGETVRAQQVGLAQSSTVTRGIMGIGFTLNVASSHQEFGSTYPTIIDNMFDQKLINLKAYSLYLDSKGADTGSIIFGGLDTEKWVGELVQLPIIPSRSSGGRELYDHFAVVMTGLVMSEGTQNTSFTSSAYRIPAILDSGTTLTYLPSTTTERIYNELDAMDDSSRTGLVFVDCSVRDRPLYFNYQFGDSSEYVEIRVPISELVYDLSDFVREESIPLLPDLPFNNPCGFGIFPSPEGVYLLGDTFLRSAYVVYDLTNNVIALAQANLNSTTSSVLDFEADATSIPRVSGVASSVDVTQTATGIFGGNGGRPTVRPTTTEEDGGVVTVTQTRSPTGNAAMRSVGAMDWSGMVVLGISGFFALVGGSLMLV